MAKPESAIEAMVIPRSRDLGDRFEVRRALPTTERRMVGPFVFFDQMGPHPHIGLATVTYLFDGEILHRDSLHTVQAIRPGEVNWMTAGRGIVHSERTAPDTRKHASSLSRLQCWVALPQRHEETDPSFHHFKADDLPMEKRRRRARHSYRGTFLRPPGARSCTLGPILCRGATAAGRENQRSGGIRRAGYLCDEGPSGSWK